MNKQSFSLWIKNEVVVLALRLLIVYIILFITQVIFYLYNRDIIGTISIGEFFVLLGGSLVFDNISILYLNSLFIFLSIIPFRIRVHKVYQKILFWIFVITNSIGIVLLNVADAVYFHFVLKRFTTEELHFLNNNNNMQIIGDAIIKNLWLIGVVILLIFLLIFTYKKIRYYPIKIKNNYTYYGVNIFLFCVVIFFWIGGIRGGYFNGFPYTLSNATLYTKTPQKANLILSNPMCIFLTIDVKQLPLPQYFNEKELESIYTPNHYPIHSAINLGKKNIVLFILESFSKEHSKFYCPELYPNEAGYTPFLDSLMKQGYVFQNAFANGGMSIEAMPSIFVSIPSYTKPFTLLPQSLGDMKGLPEMLVEKGYATSFFCGAEKNSMGFEAFATLSGIEKMYSIEDYKSDGYIVNKNTIEPMWGVFDMPFYLYFADKIDEMKQPFFTSVFNLTSHPPFALPSDFVDKVPKGHTELQPCVAYTDMSIKKFFEKVKNTNWFQNTIFVFVSDHASAITYGKYSKTPKGLKSIFWFIYTPDQSLKGINKHTVQQLDVMPTLLGLIGSQEPYFAFGRDVFNEQKIPIATNFQNQLYQCIMDSITINFDGKNTVSAFLEIDSLQQNNIMDKYPKLQKQAEQKLKAMLQVYYDRLNKKDYRVISIH